MYSFAEDNHKIEFTFSSHMYLVDRVMNECRSFLNKRGIEQFQVSEQVLRELMINAIEHGNAGDSQKIVKAALEKIGENRLKVRVADQGQGFDYSKIIPGKDFLPEQERKRGYSIIYAYSDEVLFNSSGNEITAFLSIIDRTRIEITADKGVVTIIPSGDLTASISDRLKTLLLDAVQNYESNCFRFDLERVQVIDSISLSLLITFKKMLYKKNKEAEVELINSGEDIAGFLKITQLDKVFKIIKVKSFSA